MLGAVQLDHEARSMAIKIGNIPVYHLLAEKSDRIRAEKRKPETPLFFCHILPQRLGIFRQGWVVFSLLIHGIPQSGLRPDSPLP